jgi:hypothetical protein
MDTRGYIGIDFGTANSHFAYCEHGSRDAKAIPFSAAEGKPSVPSYVLWEISSSHQRSPKAWGQHAIEEWMLSEDHDAGVDSQFILTGAFKPDLVTSPMSRDAARQFLALARQEMISNRTPPGLHEPPGWQVVIGVPAEVPDDHKVCTLEAAKKAGFEQVSCLEEPLGAVGYHLGNESITDRDLDGGVLVIDFGGGTLDLSTVDRDGVREPWGEPMLGGRLFDDLFFQWVVDSSHVDLSDFNKAELLAIWWNQCRRCKESFSRHWKRKNADDFQDFICRVETRDGGTFGKLRSASLGEFLERARHYRPSTLAQDYFRQIGSPLQHLGDSDSGTVDLIDWIKKILNRQAVRHYGTILLTGGSSSWPFMVPLVREVFGDCQTLIPPNPECTIGEGLAVWYALNRDYSARKRKALTNVPALQSSLREIVANKTKQASKEIGDEIAGHIMAVARPRFYQWHLHGGRLADVERDVAEDCRRIPVTSIIETRSAGLLPEVDVAASNEMRRWLIEQGVQLGDWRGLGLSGGFKVADLGLTVTIADDLAAYAVRSAVQLVTWSIVASLALIIAATAVTLAASPLALLALPAAGGVYLARDWVKKQLLEFAFEGDALVWLQRIYGKDKLDEALAKGDSKCRESVANAIEQQMASVREQLNQLLIKARDEVLRRYGLLEKLSNIQTAPGAVGAWEEDEALTLDVEVYPKSRTIFSRV